jgi:hypothetical protein
MTAQESRRFGAGVDGVVHVLVAYKPDRAAYDAACGAVVEARVTVVREEAEGLLCAACAAANG